MGGAKLMSQLVVDSLQRPPQTARDALRWVRTRSHSQQQYACGSALREACDSAGCRAMVGQQRRPGRLSRGDSLFCSWRRTDMRTLAPVGVASDGFLARYPRVASAEKALTASSRRGLRRMLMYDSAPAEEPTWCRVDGGDGGSSRQVAAWARRGPQPRGQRGAARDMMETTQSRQQHCCCREEDGPWRGSRSSP